MQADSDSVQQQQRRTALTAIAVTMLLATMGLGLYDLQYHTPVSIFALFGASLACVPVLILNSRGRYLLAAAILSAVALIVITANIYDGDGIHDHAILAYPVLILVGTMLFGKRAAPYFTVAAIAAATAIAFLEVLHLIHPIIEPTNFGDLIPIVILFLVAGVIIWVIIRNLESSVQRARDSEAELAQSYDRTLEAWASLLEHRDRGTEGHTQRVMQLTMRLAAALRLDGPSLIDIRRGALLHDIGKIGMPDSILLKPGALSEEEWTVVRQHPAFAHDLLAPIKYLESAAEVPWCHHEKWDGSGYPRGLRGTDIPLAARIFTVVDVWDAITSERPYRAAMPVEQARQQIRSLSGTQFDPSIVEAFLALDLTTH